MSIKINKNDVGYVMRICLVLLAITMCVAFLLSFVNAVTKDVIAKNEEAKISEALKALFDQATAPEADDVSGEFGETVNGFYTVKDGDVLIGYYANVSPVGFKGEVGMMVGLDLDGKVIGIEILTCDETIGIGTQIKEDWFLDTFKGREDSLEYKKGAGADEEGVIDGISGATYSAKAVIAGVDAAFDAYKTATGGVSNG